MRRRSPATSAPRRGSALLLATCLTFVGLLAVGMPVAQAHDQLVGSSPEADAALDAAPTEIELEFSGNIQELGTEVVVTADDGSTVSDGAPEIDGTTVLQPLAADLPAGDYTVDWRATSSDGHPLSDTFSFTVTREPTADDATAGTASSSSAAPEPTTDVGETAATRPVESSSSGLWIAVAAGVVLGLAAVVAVRRLHRRS